MAFDPARGSSEEQRRATRSLARAIAESGRVPLDVVPVHGAGEHYRRVDADDLVRRLAHEVALLGGDAA